MIAEATSSLLLAATGAPAARVGYAYVRLNGADYGLYANVENIDAVMARRWFTGTQHIYEANLRGWTRARAARASSRWTRARPPTAPTWRRWQRPMPAARTAGGSGCSRSRIWWR